MPAGRAVGWRMVKIEGLFIAFDRFALQFQAVVMPLPFHHLGKAKDHYIQKAADRQADKNNEQKKSPSVLIEKNNDSHNVQIVVVRLRRPS
jgi:hypothetical protein